MPDLVAISVGNSRARLALLGPDGLGDPVAFPLARATDLIAEARARAGDQRPFLIASVNEPFTRELEPKLAAGGRALRIGRDIPIPISTAVDEPGVVGQDRLLNALAAYTQARQACIVIDAGTCTTIDFVDGEGVFHGGAIAPGLSTMLRALHQHAPALPSVEPEVPSAELPFGRNTREAMLIGCRSAIQGLAHLLIERYSEFYEAYPRIIATGGDSATLFEGDAIIEHIVPDLTLLGMLAAVRAYEESDE